MKKIIIAAVMLLPTVARATADNAYIVEFHTHAVQSTPSPKMDNRLNKDPDGWSGVDPGVLSRLQELEDKAKRLGRPFQARYPYSHVMKGFVAEMPEDQAEMLRADPVVRGVYADRKISINAPTASWGITRTRALLSPARALGGGGAAENVNVYVIDTGIAPHGRLLIGTSVNFVGDRRNTDCNGHGTHVAGTIGAADVESGAVGILPGVRLHAVKVLGCDGTGSSSAVLKGVDWVTAHAKFPAVANMSLGAELDRQLDKAVTRSVRAGIFYALAAGNSAIDACASSPSRIGAMVSGAMTVAATDSAEAEASFSNYGGCVDIWAPGVGILSTSIGGRMATLSGTSMAAPHVAGAAALYLTRYPESTPAAVEDAIRRGAVSPGTVSRDGRPVSRLDLIGF